jgi:ferrous iron transport protein A
MTPLIWMPVVVVVFLVFCTILFAAGNHSWTHNLARLRRSRVTINPIAPYRQEVRSVGLLPLAGCARDDKACLRCVEVDRCLAHRLTELGLTPGVELRVIRDTAGPMLVAVRGSRVALGRELAEKMWVEVCPPAGEMETVFCPGTTGNQIP